jgi:hypothetical protein
VTKRNTLSNLHGDRKNTTCQRCGKGKYIEKGMDDWYGTLHCSNEKCGHILNRWPQDDKGEEKGNMEAQFKVGDKVEKVGGDYTFVGVVVSVFQKLSGAVRLVVEDDRGVLHVYSEKNLRTKND